MAETHRNNYYDYWQSDCYSRSPREYRALNFFLNTVCDRRCSECAVNIPGITSPENYPVDYIRHAASILNGIDHVTITGGEPLLHPRFKDIAPNLREWFGCSSLTLESNGRNFRKYRRLMRHFDDVLISHYHDNGEAVAMAHSLGLDGRAAGPTLHVTTARRAMRPAPCRRANFMLYVYGRLYPCACIPDGYAFIGVPLTINWRRDIAGVPLPCAECCFAEEADDDGLVVPPIDPSGHAAAHRPGESIHVREESKWPRRRDRIRIYGLTLDSWMASEARITVEPSDRARILGITFESYVPADFHPLTLSFIGESGTTVDTHVITEPGSTRVRLDTGRYLAQPGDSRITIRCDRVYTGSGRELGVRVCSLAYEQ